MWDLLAEKTEEQEIKPILDDMLDDDRAAISIPDIYQKFHLRLLHKKSNSTRNLTWTTSGVITILIIAGALYACRHRLTLGRYGHNLTFERSGRNQPNTIIRMSDVASLDDTIETFIESPVAGTTIDSSTPKETKAGEYRKKRTSKPT